MKRLFLPLTLLLSCAVAQSADVDNTSFTVDNRESDDINLTMNNRGRGSQLKHANPPDDETPPAVSLKTEHPNLATLFDNMTNIHSMVTQEHIDRNSKNFETDKTQREEQIIINLQKLHEMGANLNALNNHEKTVLEVAYENASPKIITALINLPNVDLIPLFKSSGFKYVVKDLPNYNAVIDAVYALPLERKKSILEKIDQINKEQEKAAKEKEGSNNSSASELPQTLLPLTPTVKAALQKQQEEHKQNRNPIVVGNGNEKEHHNELCTDKYENDTLS